MTGNVCYLVSDIMESVLVADDGFFQSRPYGSHFDHCKTLQLFKQSREHTCKNTSLSLHAKAFLLPSFLRRGQRGNHFRIYIAWTRFLFRRIPLCPGHAQFVRSAVGSCGMAQVRRENPLNAAAFRVRGGATRGSLLAARIQSGFTRHRRYNGPAQTDNVSRECVMMRGSAENREGRWSVGRA